MPHMRRSLITRISVFSCVALCWVSRCIRGTCDVQLFESVSVVASPGSPGSKPLSTFEAAHPPSTFDASRAEADLRVAMETAEEQAVVSSQPAKHGLREFVPERVVKFHDEVIHHEEAIQSDSDSYGPQALSQSLRQASIASCASEWVDALKNSGNSRKR